MEDSLQARINAQLYDIQGMEESLTQIESICMEFGSAIRTEAYQQQFGMLAGAYWSIAGEFCRNHGAYSHEQIDDSLDALSVICMRLQDTAKAGGMPGPERKRLRQELGAVNSAVNRGRSLSEKATEALMGVGICIVFVALLAFWVIPPVQNSYFMVELVARICVIFPLLFLIAFAGVRYWMRFKRNNTVHRRTHIMYLLSMGALFVSALSMLLTVVGIYLSRIPQ